MRNLATLALALAAVLPVGVRAENGIKAYQRGDYPAAEEAFRGKAREAEGAAPEYNLGNALYRQERFGDAAESYGEALKRDPRMEPGWYNLGNAFYRLGDYANAVQAYQKALSLESKDDDARHNLELAQKLLQEHPEKQKEKPKDTETPTPTPPSKKGPAGNQDSKGQNPDPKQKNSNQGEKGSSGGNPPPDPQQQEQQRRQEAARKSLGMSDQQVREKLDQLEKQQRQLQPYFSRNPRRERRRGDDFFNGLPKAQRDLMRQFFGNKFPGAPQEPDQPEKDW